MMHCGKIFQVKEKSKAVILATIKKQFAGCNHQIKKIKWQKSRAVQIPNSNSGFVTNLLNLLGGRFSEKFSTQ